MEIWQQFLDAIGSVLSWIYDVIPNYGIAIIILTVLVRLVLLPLGIKQIRSMHAMQAVQPKIKQIQAKHKNDKAKAQEEIMKVYQEHGVNPLGGCLPLLLQMPILISLYAVLRYPVAPEDMHVPQNSALQEAIVEQAPGVHFLGANLLCSASQAGKGEIRIDVKGEPVALDCGTGTVPKIPQYFLILLMAATTYFQQWQMQRASPPGSAQKQQQMIARVMPVLFLFFFWGYPSGMVLYWAMSNVWQIGQQHFLLRAIKKEQANGKPTAKPRRKGMMQKMMEQAEAQRAAQQEVKGGGKETSKKPSKGQSGSKGKGKGESGRPKTDGEKKGQGGKGSQGSKGSKDKGSKPRPPKEPGPDEEGS